MKITVKKGILVYFLILTGLICAIFIFANLPDKPANINIILISVDALRPDHLGCYGYRRDTSPNIDRLASEGILFTQAISQGAATVPSLPSLMTSLYPYQHGVLINTYKTTIAHPVLAQILKDNGYSTCAIVANNILHTGIAKGFDYACFDFDMHAELVTQKAVNWLKVNKDKKIFLWLHYFDTHGPYRPPVPYAGKYIRDKFYTNDKKINISHDQEHLYRGTGEIPEYIADNGMTNPDYYVARYDGAINFADAQIGILLQAIKELGLDGKTLIILTADHGEYLGEHDIYFTHGHTLYDQVIKVPLIIKFKGVLPAGRKFDRIVAHIDLAPTILKLAHIRADIKYSGINLVPFILNKKRYPTRTIFTELWRDAQRSGRLTILLISARTDKWKLIKNMDTKECWFFNLRDDPGELRYLLKPKKIDCMLLEQKLGTYEKQFSKAVIKSGYPLDQELRDRLKSFGYLQ
jgi:arylsulfatase A-like enzyme